MRALAPCGVGKRKEPGATEVAAGLELAPSKESKLAPHARQLLRDVEQRRHPQGHRRSHRHAAGTVPGSHAIRAKLPA